MPRPQDHGAEPRALSHLMTLVKTGASPEDIATARREYRRLVAERKRRELDEYEAEAELQAAGHDGA